MKVFVFPVDFGAASTFNSTPEERDETEKTVPIEREFDPQTDLSWHAGHSSLWWTLRALENARRVDQIEVIGDDSPALRRFLETEIAGFSRVELRLFSIDKRPDAAPKNVDSMEEIRAHLQQLCPHLREPSLVCTASTPLAAGEDYDEFIRQFQSAGGEGALPVVSREKLENLVGAPEKPMFSPFADDLWRMGFCAIVTMPVLENLLDWTLRMMQTAEKMAEMEGKMGQKPGGYGPMIKLSWKLAREIGWIFLWRAIRRRLTLAEAEKKASRLLQCRVRALEVSRPELAILSSQPKFAELAAQRLR